MSRASYISPLTRGRFFDKLSERLAAIFLTEEVLVPNINEVLDNLWQTVGLPQIELLKQASQRQKGVGVLDLLPPPVDSYSEEAQRHGRVLTCVDERLHVRGKTIPLVAAGLTGNEEDLLRLIVANDINTLTSHDDCAGMTKVYLRGHSHLPPPKIFNAWIRDEAARRVTQINTWMEQHNFPESSFVNHQHITADCMRCQPGVHPAVAACLDYTRKISRGSSKVFSFVVGRRYGSFADGNLETCLHISLDGGRGFGSRFTPDNPFHLVVLGCPSRPAGSSVVWEEAKQAAQAYGDRVKLIAVGMD